MYPAFLPIPQGMVGEVLPPAVFRPAQAALLLRADMSLPVMPGMVYPAFVLRRHGGLPGCR